MSATGDNIAGQVSLEAQQMLQTFWDRAAEEIHNLTTGDFKNHELPLARIKKIMKLDEDVKMISAEAPVLFSKAAEIFVSELSLRAWVHTEENKRRTLQRNDIALAITKYDQFDFLIDIVPREELKPAKRDETVTRTSVGPDQVQYIFQLAQQNSAQNNNGTPPQNISMQAPAVQQPTPPQQQQQQQQQQPIQIQFGAGNPLQTIQLQQGAGDGTAAQPQVIQLQAPAASAQVTTPSVVTQAAPTQQTVTQAATPVAAQTQQQTDAQAGQPTQFFQQVLTPNGEIQTIPLQLPQAMMQNITLQMQGKQPGQPILIQTLPQGGEQGVAAEAGQESASDQQLAQPLFQVPMTIGGQQVFIQQSDEASDGQEAT